jgi:hypothetical protein
MAFSEYSRDVKKFARHNAWFQNTALLLFGVLASVVVPVWWVVPLLLVVFLAFQLGQPLLKTHRRLQAVDLSLHSDRSIRDPDPLAERRVLESAEPHLVVGSAVETLIHSTLNSRADYLEAGWDPAHVRILDTKRLLDPGPILSRFPDGLIPLAPNEANDTKFVLVAHSHPLKDDEDNLTLSFARTNWQIHKTVRLASRPTMNWRLSSED